ncbi:hypothetical protein ACFQ1L_24045 [Phytohabitans flavus]|uniref:hypothetical protein n=1 Tax=Phytohabitans flavus TaxID=1076124 RepID=UPI00363AC901
MLSSNAVTQPEATRRTLARMEARRAALSADLSTVEVRRGAMERTGRRWMAAAGLCFLVWSGVLLVEAATLSPGPRQSAWYDPLQVNVEQVVLADDPQGVTAQLRASLGGQPAALLLLGRSDGQTILFDQRQHRLVIITGDPPPMLSP